MANGDVGPLTESGSLPGQPDEGDDEFSVLVPGDGDRRALAFPYVGPRGAVNFKHV